MLARHLRYAGRDPRKLAWIARRIVEIVLAGRVAGVFERHRGAIEDVSPQYVRWMRDEAEITAVRRESLLRDSATWMRRPRFSVLVPVFHPVPAFLRSAVSSVLAQSYGEWELCIVDDASSAAGHLQWLGEVSRTDPRIKVRTRVKNGGIAVATNDALALATGEFVLFLDQDDVLAQDTLLEFAVAATVPDVDVIFADEDRIDSAGKRSNPFFKPGFDAEWLRTTNCVLHPLAVRTRLMREVGGLATGVDGAQDWELLLRLSERLRPASIRHVPRILYHWREHPGSTAAGVYEKPQVQRAQLRILRQVHARRHEQATFEMRGGSWRIRRKLPTPVPLVSIVVPTRDHAELLERCVHGLRKRTDYPRWECVVVDNGSTKRNAVSFLSSLRRDARFRILRDDGEFNYARLCNLGSAASKGDIVVFLNNDIEPINAGWLTELTVNALRPEIGLVGAMLYYPDRTIQHAGVVLWLNGVADRPYIGLPRGFHGIDNRLSAVHTVTAMITACAAIRSSVLRSVGGMDESLPVACNDLDLCLRVSDAGYRNVITPHAELYHLESASRGYHYRTAESQQETVDESAFRARWLPRLPRDPTYNPNFTLKGAAFTLSSIAEHSAGGIRTVP